MVTSFKRRACQKLQTISKETFIAYLTQGSKRREFFESLDDENWYIYSFDPTKREVCVVILNDANVEVTTTVNLPQYLSDTN